MVTFIGLVIVAAAALYISWPLFSGAEGDPVAQISEASELEKEKEAALEAIRELDFDLKVGKISTEDHTSLRGDLEKRALAAMTALDQSSDHERSLRAIPGQGEGSGGDAAGFCPSCGKRFKHQARFCVSCGEKLPKTRAAPEKRRKRGQARS